MRGPGVESASLPIERNGIKMFVASRNDLIGINIKDGSKRAVFLLLPINVIPSYPGPPKKDRYTIDRGHAGLS